LGGQRLGYRVLAVGAKGTLGGPARWVVELGQAPLEAAVKSPGELVLEYDTSIDDCLVPTGT
jgi:hypothetical protein